jgi:hypothetical protein
MPGLYVGNIRDSEDRELLELHRITHVVSILDNPKELFSDKQYMVSHVQNVSVFKICF